MAQPKRKSPDKKSSDRKSSGKTARRKGPSVAERMLQSTVAGIARYPRLIGGVTAFAVVFSFVAANALWYQPKHHPAPLLATRMFESDIKNGRKARPVATEEVAAEPGVTTFRIERQADNAGLADAQADTVKPSVSPLVRDVQQALSARGLYDGPADGLTGPRTTSAILFFQETEGLEQTGEASIGLLASIKALGSNVAVIPDPRPSPDVTASTRRTDDVAALIREAEGQSVSATRPTKISAPDKSVMPVSPDTVMKIQKALSRLAYAKVKVDGVAGEATKAAIRAFEKNYNLPVTGEPSERVVQKLKSIGAI